MAPLKALHCWWHCVTYFVCWWFICYITYIFINFFLLLSVKNDHHNLTGCLWKSVSIILKSFHISVVQWPENIGKPDNSVVMFYITREESFPLPNPKIQITFHSLFWYCKIISASKFYPGWKRKVSFFRLLSQARGYAENEDLKYCYFTPCF